MSNSDVRTSSATSSAPTLRPRVKRLISGLDEGDETTFDPANARPTRIASPLLAPYDTRPASPIPSAHPQRSKSSTNLRSDAARAGGTAGRNAWGTPRKTGSATPNSLAGIWGTSWNALQGLASEFLGNDLSGPSDKDRPRVRRPLSKLENHRSVSSSSVPRQWGPSASSSSSQTRSGGIGAGTREEQTAALRAQKRKDLLTRSEASYADSLGKFKRRLSDDRASMSAPPTENEDREALVYLHPVKKDDTLAGITIRYNISANVLRKANRMWPNDQVQVRQVLMLPVDACGVKGRPVGGPEDVDLLGSESESLSVLQAEEVPLRSPPMPAMNGPKQAHTRTRTNSTSTNNTASAATAAGESTPPWQHDCWVLLPGNTKPTEIGRLPRRAMGYFPPARRKSISYSDFDSPSTSLDLARSSDVDGPEPSASPKNTPPRPARHGRRLSNATNGYFPAYLTGPGGVGTMGKRVHYPGPAQDGLNKLFAKHLPDVAPPRNQHALYQPEVPLSTATADDVTPTGSGAVTPAFAHMGGGSSGGVNINIENVGGAIESWVRRLAAKAKSPPADRRHAARASVGAPGRGAGSVGDLIEMTNEFEIGADEEDEEEFRGRQGSETLLPVAAGPASSATRFQSGNAARERVMNGREIGKGVEKRGKAD